ncbi:lytic polysaccharide monooxygenase [Microbulbifer sp.]|uniref:lytic polysaccharide monooxygenase n=1 Tax=Microbulbifer sp. TaxID=1908541 RepID=UPI002583B2DB|nr:lytic polysaccharide monooxygenase [Microbulbifer sp.]
MKHTIHTQANRSRALTLMSGVLTLLASGLSTQSLAHGSMEVPESRIYNCFLNNPENPSDPACAAAKAVGGTQPFYDWNEINQANANGNHRALIPDGQLCSGGRSKYAGMDLARPDWQATPITPNADGTFDFEFYATAPHSTRDWVFYITRQGYTGENPLQWDDLFEFCRLGDVPVGADKRYTLTCPLPELTGKHVIYTTWQRSDSPEAFYTCTDVILGDGGSSPWADEGALQAQTDLTAGSTISLRLFNSAGNDMETLSFTLQQDMAAAEWALAFAQSINSQSQYARIGILNPDDGSIAPIASATENRVYTQADLSLSHEIDIALPDTNRAPSAVIDANPTSVTGAGIVNLSAAGSSDPDGDTLSYQWSASAGTLSGANSEAASLSLPAPSDPQTVTINLQVSDGELSAQSSVNITHNPEGQTGGDYDYVYPEGIGSYVPGETVVQGSDGNLYRCRPFPEGQWCNINSAYHYAPGTGSNWSDAWIAL